MSIEFKTPFEIIEELSHTIEKTRKRKKIRQKDLCKECGVPISTYQKFLYEKTINLANLIKIMYFLNMMSNLENFIKYEEILTIDDIRNRQKDKKLPKRVRVKNEK
jgi:transcriptional regulator with XRE-family HTH domain